MMKRTDQAPQGGAVARRQGFMREQNPFHPKDRRHVEWDAEWRMQRDVEDLKAIEKISPAPGGANRRNRRAQKAIQRHSKSRKAKL